jgi:hypothetical protein
MQQNEHNSDDTDTNGHMAAVLGLIIGIVLGSAILNFVGNEMEGDPAVGADAFSSARTGYRG